MTRPGELQGPYSNMFLQRYRHAFFSTFGGEGWAACCEMGHRCLVPSNFLRRRR